ncbi:hypothetical protein GmHk_20G058545 [Glycine max]|nr:hypothetical protein GmHk_20G058545 [Glycine max]
MEVRSCTHGLCNHISKALTISVCLTFDICAWNKQSGHLMKMYSNLEESSLHLSILVSNLHYLSTKEILNELEGLLGDVTNAIQTTDGNLLALSDLDFDVELNEPEEKDALSRSQSPDVTTTKKKKSIDVPHLAMVMAFIYSMVKQDYLMQEKIVSALDVKMPSEELESYCQMWSLRPFINDEIVHQAWEHIH